MKIVSQMRVLRFSRWSCFKPRSSGLWRRVVLWYSTSQPRRPRLVSQMLRNLHFLMILSLHALH